MQKGRIKKKQKKNNQTEFYHVYVYASGLGAQCKNDKTELTFG